MAANLGVEVLSGLYERSKNVLENLRDSALALRVGPQATPRFTATEAAEMCGRSAQTIRDAQKVGRLPSPTGTEASRKYSLAEVNQMRDVFGTRLHREETDPVSIISCSNFKGGVSKTTTAAHLGQHFARRGYQTLLVDCDSQASLTSLFGKVPDVDVDDSNTLAPFLREMERPSLDYAITRTHWDGLDLIPANLRLYDVEYVMAGHMARGGGTAILKRLRQGLDSIADRYDVIVIDPPPALGQISLSVMSAANALVVPVPPTVMDFSSTASFFSMLASNMEFLVEHGLPFDLKWVKILLSRVDDNKSIQKEIIKLIRDIYGSVVLQSVMRDSAEIDNATARLSTVYELEKPITRKEVHERARRHLDAVCNEIEIEVRKTWPSHTRALADLAVI